MLDICRAFIPTAIIAAKSMSCPEDVCLLLKGLIYTIRSSDRSLGLGDKRSLLLF